jgi:hypothetical protein
MTKHIATTEQWAQIESWMETESAYSSCLFELRTRVEVLERNATCPHIRNIDEGISYCALAAQTANTKPTPNPNQIRSSLVERVQRVIAHSYPDDARAAIVEVAAWLREAHDWTVAPALLEQEAER